MSDLLICEVAAAQPVPKVPTSTPQARAALRAHLGAFLLAYPARARRASLVRPLGPGEVAQVQKRDPHWRLAAQRGGGSSSSSTSYARPPSR